MKYVDVAWPWGLVFLGSLEIYKNRITLFISILIVFRIGIILEEIRHLQLLYYLGKNIFSFNKGLRMGVPGLKMIPKMKNDFPRY